MSSPALAAAADERKTAAVAGLERIPAAGSVMLRGAAAARAILRSKHVRQAGFGSELPPTTRRFTNPPVLFLDGEAHQRQRLATARFFSPKVVGTRYRELMEAKSDELVARLRGSGRAVLESLSMELAVAVAGEIVGLTDSDPIGMAARLEALLSSGEDQRRGTARSMRSRLTSMFRLWRFFQWDVHPAIRARRKVRREDVISHLIDEEYSTKEITTECLTYAIAGMVTTREFIVVACWHMLERDELRERFLSADQGGQIAILEEILRLEPVIGALVRRLAEDIILPGEEQTTLVAGTLVEINVRDANGDEEAVGPCPYSIDPDRAVARKPMGSMFSFGDGVHRCPGASVAMLETAIFLDRLLRIPGFRMEHEPAVGWNPLLSGYEMRHMVVACDVTPKTPAAPRAATA